MNKLYIMCALISLVILTIRVTYLFSTCPIKLLDCQASIALEENVIVILLCDGRWEFWGRKKKIESCIFQSVRASGDLIDNVMPQFD